jgi:hypothetical protein
MGAEVALSTHRRLWRVRESDAVDDAMTRQPP